MTRSVVIRGLVVLACVWLGSPVAPTAQQRSPDRSPLPDFDVRAGRGTRPPAPGSAAGAALQRIQSRAVGALRTRQHPLAPGARLLFAEGGALTQPAAGTPDAIAWAFLSENHEALGLARPDLDNLVKRREYRSASESITHITYEQVVEGIRVFGADVRVHVNATGEIVLVSSSAVPVSPARREAVVSPGAAVRAAVSSIRPELSFEPQPIRSPGRPGDVALFGRGPFARDIRAVQVLFPDETGVHPAWRVVVEPDPAAEAYEVVVDGVSGVVVYRRSLVYYAEGSGTVLQSDATRLLDPRQPDVGPLGSVPGGASDPQNGCPPIANRASRALATPFRDPNGVLFDTGRLEGNNVHVFRGSTGVEGAAGTLDPNGAWRFDFPFNSADSAEAQLFYIVNFAHDFFYDLGFDEPAGNFQVDNYGRGGIGNDSLIAIARASGRNNANIAVPEDGTSPWMNMFLWDGRGCWAEDVDGDGLTDLDGTVDADIVVHEFHHGVHGRLNTNWSGAEAGAMGEGGGDFFSYSIFGDTRLADYSAPPNGIREIDAKRYGDWACLFNVFCDIHELGKMWANLLWDLRERFRADGVGGGDGEAIRRVHQLYIDGLKLSPAAPTMLEMRDAMLVADLVRHPSNDPLGSENACRMWHQFALRGMGADARDTKDTGTLTVVEGFAVPPACPPLPPWPTVTIAATTPTAFEAGTVPGVFAVTRDGATSSALTVMFTTSGTAVAGSDYAPLSGRVTIPEGAASATIAVTPVNDTAVENDEVVNVTLRTSPVYNVGTPGTATVTIKSDDVLPDLTVTSLSAPATAGAGSTITVSNTIQNKGTGGAGPSVTRLYLSANALIDAGDEILAENAVPALAAGVTHAQSSSVTLRAQLTAGTYYLFAVADAYGQVAETLESNNKLTALLKIGPDLTVSALTAPATAGPGSSILVNDTTKNQGAGAADASHTRFYLSPNTTFDASDAQLGGRAVPSLAPNGTHAASTSVTIPATTPAGSYYLFAVGDADTEVVETLETNNTKFVSIKVGADLVISTLTVPAVGGAGGAISVADTTKNQGIGSAAASSTSFYLSTNFSLDPSDVALSSRAVPMLATGASSSATTTLTLPADVSAGTYYLIANADSGTAVAEATENNNTKFSLIRIGPDLTGLLSAPIAAKPGASVSITHTTRNTGGGEAGQSDTYLYLSTDTVSDVGDTLLGQRTVLPLAAGVASTVTTTVTLPSGLTPGRYYLIAKVDAGDAVVETMETNNVAFKLIDIQ